MIVNVHGSVRLFIRADDAGIAITFFTMCVCVCVSVCMFARWNNTWSEWIETSHSSSSWKSVEAH